ncbi:hypothetical protein ACP26L_17685 [Paenibacillus sp. S-38]|uniref:hypothetical protein n=1 Tax=Paenibacillus sp. S-38 TaxID=3416710 RepID=UPI003CEAA383
MDFQLDGPELNQITNKIFNKILFTTPLKPDEFLLKEMQYRGDFFGVINLSPYPEVTILNDKSFVLHYHNGSLTGNVSESNLKYFLVGKISDLIPENKKRLNLLICNPSFNKENFNNSTFFMGAIIVKSK